MIRFSFVVHFLIFWTSCCHFFYKFKTDFVSSDFIFCWHWKWKMMDEIRKGKGFVKMKIMLNFTFKKSLVHLKYFFCTHMWIYVCMFACVYLNTKAILNRYNLELILFVMAIFLEYISKKYCSNIGCLNFGQYSSNIIIKK